MKEANEQANEMFAAWYKKLNKEHHGSDPVRIESNLAVAQEEYVRHGGACDTYALHQPADNFISTDVAVKFLIGTLELRTYVADRLEESRSWYEAVKQDRTMIHKCITTGKGIPEDVRAIADAIRDEDALTMSVTLKKDGLVQKCKMFKSGLQDALIGNGISSPAAFRPKCSGQGIIDAFSAGTRSIPLSCISRVSFRDNLLYVR